MNGRMDAPDVVEPPTWQFSALVLGSPIAAGAAAFAGAIVADASGVGVALVLLAAIYAWFLAYEPAIRRMPALYRIGWVLAGLAFSAALVLAAFYVSVVVIFSM